MIIIRKGRVTGNVAFLTDSWSSSLWRFSETYAKYLSTFDLVFNHRSGFRRGLSTSDVAFLNESWASSFRRFSETCAVALDISKACDSLV